DRGVRISWGTEPASELTRAQSLEQCKMSIAALRIGDRFGCDMVGFQYQHGVMDLVVACDLAVGLLNNLERPPVYSRNGRELYPGEALPHFNEVDECAGLDALVTYRLWSKLGLDPENTLHDIRWGEWLRNDYIDAFVWVLLISGAAPPAHFIGGYSGAS